MVLKRQFGGRKPAPPDGKKLVCMDSRFDIKPGDCRVFSFGVNNEWSFEDEFDEFGCKVSCLLLYYLVSLNEQQVFFISIAP